MKQNDSASAQNQRTGAGDLSPMLHSLKDRANQAVKSAKDAVTNALQSIEGDDDSASTGQGTSGEEKNIKDKKQSTKDKRRDEVDKDNNKNNNKTPKPTRHATENDPYSPPTFPPTLNDAIKEAQEDSSGSKGRSQNPKSSKLSKPGVSSMTPIEQSKTKSKL